MIRNKINYLLHFKPRNRPGWREPLELPPIWFEESTANKESLKFIATKSEEIRKLVERLRYDQGVLLNRQISDQLAVVLQEIGNVEKWAESLQGFADNPTEQQVLSNMNSYFLSQVAIYVRKLNSYKSQFSNLINPVSPTFVETHNGQKVIVTAARPSLAVSRQHDLQFVSSKLQNLNILLRQMNTMIFDQGSVIDRIDFNLQQSEQNMVKANQHLRERKEYEEGEFGCTGRANKCIMFLYLLNLLLMLLWLAKHIAKK